MLGQVSILSFYYHLHHEFIHEEWILDKGLSCALSAYVPRVWSGE
jgi:hypothetical protein